MQRVRLREITAKSVLSRSGIPGVDYCLNPYVGCAHGCRYCYAAFMKRFTGHSEPWGSFVDAKVNAPEVLRRQVSRAARGYVMISSVTDPYQPLEEKYGLTRGCLEVLLAHQVPVGILTKSPLVLRDLDLICRFRQIEVGITVTTNDERIRRAFEPDAPSIEARIGALREMHRRSVRTYAFIGPLLPQDPAALAGRIRPHVDSALADRMNYASKTRGLYRGLGLEEWLEDAFLEEIFRRLEDGLAGIRMEIC